MEVLRNVRLGILGCEQWIRSNDKIIIFSFVCLGIQRINMKKRRGLVKEVLAEFIKGK